MYNRKLRNDQSGTTAVEYALIASFITISAITAFMSVGGEVSKTYSSVGESVSKSNGVASGTGNAGNTGGGNTAGGGTGTGG